MIVLLSWSTLVEGGEEGVLPLGKSTFELLLTKLKQKLLSL